MTASSNLTRELETLWLTDIPVTAAMGVRIASYDGATLCVRAPLEPNHNPHGTAFAGSLYSLCVLTGWGSVWLALRSRGIEALLVAADSTIRYRRAVGEELVCKCTVDASALEAALAEFATNGKARLMLACTIDAGDERAVTFAAQYAIHAQPTH
jgi:thioesterase domain-containing protein